MAINLGFQDGLIYVFFYFNEGSIRGCRCRQYCYFLVAKKCLTQNLSLTDLLSKKAGYLFHCHCLLETLMAVLYFVPDDFCRHVVAA